MSEENMFYKLRCKCTYNENKNQQSSDVKQSHCKYKNEDLPFNMEQRTFISFSTDIVCIIAFIFFGSVMFWLAITRILIDCLKKIYHSDRCTKILAAGLFTILLFSITTRILLNQRAWNIRLSQEKVELIKKNISGGVNTPVESLETRLPKQENFKVSLKDKHLTNFISKNKTDINIPKRFTMTIVDEKKKELFKTSKDFVLPKLPVEMKSPPSLIVSLTDIVLENY